MNSMKSLEGVNCKIDRGQIAAGNNVTQKDIHRNAVIGGGAGGLSFCVQFYGKIKSVPLNSLVEILVFEKGKEIGTGLPYSWEDDVFITNTPKCNHNVSVGYEGHFTQWLEDNGYDYGWTDFPPRHVFGKYLKAQADLLLKKATKHPNIRLRYLTETEVLDIRHAESSDFETVSKQYVVLSRDIKGNSYVEWRANEIVLCSGHFPSDPYREFQGNPGYVHNLSGEYERMSSIPKNEDVVVIGSRLSAVDVVLQLSSQRHRGRIIMASRSGLLPIVFNPTVNADKRCVVYPWHVGPSYEEPDTCQHLNQTSYKFESDFGDLDTIPLDKIVQTVLQDLGKDFLNDVCFLMKADIISA
ncbi:FAD-NAD(P)-binding domain-containing protein [Ditylenchus destructor]|uniref:FAD-NAD(P)-binding domain-containing protein n=1 Tax=Ditylenchus destructor TaxID=166010 RepID=A0AAD4MZS5_9BILA|nr:FAD-NAD(P)-binding domain-containing protein [Ditylenchus destructor]